MIYCQDIVRGTEREGGRWGERERVGGREREGERGKACDLLPGYH